jgi:MoaA/NifB/PqqE/SkfB family radical SAM enzyme
MLRPVKPASSSNQVRRPGVRTLEPTDLVRADRGMGEGGAANQIANDMRDLRKNVEINVGKACNNKCVFCLDGMPSREDRNYMRWDAMVAELDRWRAAGHESVGFLGGEPTTYRHLVEAIAYAREIGFTRIAIASNIMRLRRPAYAESLLDAGLTRVTVSIHGHTPELEDKITRVPGGFDKKMTALRTLIEARDAGRLPDGLSINPVLNGWNYRHLLPMMRFFFDEVGLDDMRVNFARPEGYAEGDPELCPPYHKVVPVVMKAVALNERYFRKTFTFGGFPLCVLPAAFRRSRPLMERYIGEFRDLSTDCSVRADGGGPDGVSEHEGGRQRFNWQDRKRYDLKGHPDACDGCAALAVCEGAWGGYLEIWGDDALRTLGRGDLPFDAREALARVEER